MGAPMIKNLGNMDDPTRLFRDAQYEVIVLASVETLTEATDFANDTRPSTLRWPVYIWWRKRSGLQSGLKKGRREI